MSRIDANLATQLGDIARPQQSQREGQLQAAEAKRQELVQSDSRATKPTGAEELRATAQSLQQVIEVATGRQLDFKVNDKFKELVVQISDRNSGEVIKEIPSKDIMKLRERISDLIGMFIDEKV